ncbi:hypothetical protein PWT90_06758 [Aphanocladium album]|nr:hypothetical protein PWT90_06758 [Aphanocladium album]
MTSPSADTKSRFERFFASSEGKIELQRQLDRASVARQEATPEPSFSDLCSTEEDHKWECAILHEQFERRKLDNIRHGVKQLEYWKAEYQQYKKDLLRQSNEKEKKGGPTAQQYKEASFLLRRVLELGGWSLDETDRSRFSIENPEYWTCERDVLQHHAALQEHQAHEAARKKRKEIQRRRQARVERCLESKRHPSPPRRMDPSPNQAQQHEGCIATRTRSRTRIGIFRPEETRQRSPHRTTTPPPTPHPYHASAFHRQLSSIRVCLHKMTNPGAIDYSDVVLIIGNVDGADEILNWSENSRFAFTPPVAGCSWRGDQPSEQELKGPFLCLKIGENLFDPRGWILGSHGDSDACDLQLATTNQLGISRQACRIDIDPKTHKPRVTQLSDRQFRIYGPSLIRCQRGVPQVLPSPATIDFGVVKFRVWTPKRTATEAFDYTRKARKYSEDIMGSIPKPLPPLPSHKKTSAESVRSGADGALYVVDGQGVHGRGAHASVMRVKKIETGEYFGAKEPYFKISDNADVARHRFEVLRTEYNHIKRLDHAFDLVVAEDLTLPPWMIIEYIPLNLREALHTFDEHERIATMTHLGSALMHLHANGITHRDLKPDNALVVRQDGVLLVKLADFGTSKQNASATMDTFTGTEIYMAPELFAKPRCYTSKVDMWALGLIGMQLFSSWDPDTDDRWDPNNFAVWVCTVALPSIAEAPGFLQPMIKKLLRRDARRRWSSRKCLGWLWKHESLNSPPVSGPGTDQIIRHKRRASKDLRRYSEEYYSRRRRSPNPSLSTARARLSEQRDECSLPDTASPVSGDLDLPSVASTPRADETISDWENSSDEESSGGDTDLEDWQME